MEDLIQKVADSTGISAEQAKSAIVTVVDHLKDKLPFGLGEKIESFISGNATDAPANGEGIFDEIKEKLQGGLSGLFS